MSHPEFLPSVLFELFVKRFPLFLNVRLKESAIVAPEGGSVVTDSSGTSLLVNPSRPYIKQNLDDMYSFMGSMLDNLTNTKSNRTIYKRREEGFVQIPLISAKSIYRLVSVLFYKKDDTRVRVARIWITVLMTIGPNSGL